MNNPVLVKRILILLLIVFISGIGGGYLYYKYQERQVIKAKVEAYLEKKYGEKPVITNINRSLEKEWIVSYHAYLPSVSKIKFNGAYINDKTIRDSFMEYYLKEISPNDILPMVRDVIKNVTTIKCYFRGDINNANGKIPTTLEALRDHKIKLGLHVELEFNGDLNKDEYSVEILKLLEMLKEKSITLFELHIDFRKNEVSIYKFNTDYTDRISVEEIKKDIEPFNK